MERVPVPAAHIAARVLKPAGGALMKQPVAVTRRQFAKVKLCKPEASRSRSPEVYLLAKGYRLV